MFQNVYSPVSVSALAVTDLGVGVRRLVTIAGLGLVSLLVACSSTPQAKPAVSAPAPTPTLQRFMDEAVQARLEGSKNKERAAYRAAAAAYPTAKEPWVKLTESYFEDADYAGAILAAQEVIQRDSSDNAANSVLAVSGLRVSVAALTSLRQSNNLGQDTRAQAEGVAKLLRDVLGAPLLAPAKPEAPVAAPVVAPARPAARPAPTRATQPAKAAATQPSAPVSAAPKASASPATPSAASVPAPAAAPAPTPAPTPAVTSAPAPKAQQPAAPASPFDKLK